MDGEQQGDIQAAIDAGRELTQVIQDVPAGALALVAQPMGHTHQIVDFERFLPNPRRATGTVEVRDVESFTKIVNRFKTPACVAYAHEDGVIVAVVNDHVTGEPAWRDHRIVLDRPVTKAFAAWQHAFAQGGMTQQQFATFLEDRLSEIAEPPGADLLEIAQEFRASRSLKFRQQHRLSNGQQQVEYVEELEGGGGREGKITMPEEVTVVVAPYRDSAVITFIARVRWTLADQAVRFSLVPVEGKRTRPDGLEILGLQDALEGLHDDAIEQVVRETGVLVVRGEE